MTPKKPSVPKPKTIGKYRIDKVIGRGAMGVVYLARDPTIDRPVALKTINLPEGLDEAKVEEFRARFIREARAAGQLNHPAIVTIYEADDGAESGIPFIAMEYVEGLPWNFKIRQGVKQEPTAILPLIRELASALAYAHKEGVIHRDIKPANIVQTPAGHVKLMDFGIAKVPTSELTREGQFLGTPAYMSPEQVMGKAVDGRSDLFSLGTVLYELLSCNKPFPGEEITTVSYNICKTDPEPVRSLNPSLPEEVDEILGRMLAKNPDHRYAKAGLLVEDLDAYLAGVALPHAGTVEPPPPAGDGADVTVLSPPAAKAPSKKEKKAPPADKKGPSSLRRGMAALLSLSPMTYITAMVGFFLLLVVLAGVIVMIRRPADLKLAAPGRRPLPVESFSAPLLELKGVQAKAEEEGLKPIVLFRRLTPPTSSPSLPRWSPEGTPTQKTSPGEVKTPQAVPAPAPPPARVTYSFKSKLLKGTFEISVDGKVVVKKTVHRKFSFKDKLYTGSFQVPPGRRDIAFKIHTEIQNVTGTHKESVDFSPGQRRTLTIIMTRFNKELRFAWGS